MTVDFSEFFGSATDGEKLTIVLKHDGVEVGRYNVTSNDGDGDYSFTISSDAAFDQVEFTAAQTDYDGSDDNSDFAIKGVTVFTDQGAQAIGTVTGDVNGSFGTDGAGGYFMWADADGDGDNEAVSFMEARADDGTLLYTMSMDPGDGSWTVHQYADDATFQEAFGSSNSFDMDVRIYDGDGDWATGSVTVPVSQFVVGSDAGDTSGSTAAYTVGDGIYDAGSGVIDGGEAADVLVGIPAMYIRLPSTRLQMRSTFYFWIHPILLTPAALPKFRPV
jgi:hypothetical protein